jgi:hypothetical protein
MAEKSAERRVSAFRPETCPHSRCAAVGLFPPDLPSMGPIGHTKLIAYPCREVDSTKAFQTLRWLVTKKNEKLRKFKTYVIDAPCIIRTNALTLRGKTAKCRFSFLPRSGAIGMTTTVESIIELGGVKALRHYVWQKYENEEIAVTYIPQSTICEHRGQLHCRCCCDFQHLRPHVAA